MSLHYKALSTLGENTCILLKNFVNFVNVSFLLKGGTNNINLDILFRAVGKNILSCHST